MQISCIIQTTKTNFLRTLLLFIVLIGFCSSTIDKKNVIINLDVNIILKKLELGD